MITLLTNHPLAEDSDDHHHPDGIYLDNNYNQRFVSSVEEFYKRPIALLDLGCAGGELVCRMLGKGHIAVGLEGSDHCLNIDSDAVTKYSSMPLGHQNWQTYGNKNLFTCDITYDYELKNNNSIMQFDLITCFDVMEHFFEERIDTFCQMVLRHLKPDGIFVASIALFNLEKNHIEYHKSLFTREKWAQILAGHFKSVPFPFVCTNRGHPAAGDSNNIVFAGMRK